MMRSGNGKFRGPEWGPSITSVPLDSSDFPHDFQGDHTFLSMANASPHQNPAWDLLSSRWRGHNSQQQQETGGHDLEWGTPSSRGMIPPGHTQQQQQQRELRNVQNIQGYIAQIPPGYLSGAGWRSTNPVTSSSPLNNMQQERGRLAMMPFSESHSFTSWGEGRLNTVVLGDNKLGLVESLATRVYNDLLKGLEGVSTGKVAQATLLALGVPSFETMGLMLQDVPCLRKLSLIESKVNTFVHSHVAGKKITTLYDLILDLTLHEGVKEFEDLGLGPLLCHPLVGYYFSPPMGVEVHKITAGEVIQHLSDYIGNHGKDTRVQIECFLAYVAKKQSLPTPEHLCVRIQSLGMHIGFIRRAKKAETELITIWESQSKAEFVKKRKPSVMERVDSFLEAEREKDAFLGKHKYARFSSNPSPRSQDDSHIEGGTERFVVVQNNTPRCKVKLDNTCPMTFPTISTACPYPSAAEERARVKKQDLQEFVVKSEHEDFYLSSAQLQQFVTILKAACENHSVHEVLMKLIDSSWEVKGIKKRSRKSKIFKAYPAIGLLNVAVLSVKAGHWDGMYRNVLNAAVETDGPSIDETRAVQAAAPLDVDSNPKQSTPCQASGLPVLKDIIAGVCEHYECYLKPQIAKGGLETDQDKHRAWWLGLHWVCGCEEWIAGKHSVGSFASLGFGRFSHFLEQYVELLPPGIISFLGEKNKRSKLISKVPQERVVSFLAQAGPLLPEGGSPLQDLISDLLYRQFNISSIEELGANSLDSLLEMSKDQKARVAPSNHVFFLEPLIASRALEISKLRLWKESHQTELAGVVHETRVGVLGSMTSADAARCLLNAPFLADLSEWSQWDAVFAPTLGDLLDWFERDGSKTGLHAILTCEGTLLRIDGTATAGNFLLATAKGCGKQMAAVLTSLIALHGGTANTPTALLTSLASKGLEILLGSSGDDETFRASSSLSVVNIKRQFTEHLGGQEAKLSCTYGVGKLTTSAEPTSSGSSALQANAEERIAVWISPQSSVATQCVMECLSHVIPDFQIFTAEILLPALSPLIAGTPAVLLRSCSTLQQKCILHSVGLSLGIPEWTRSYSICVFGPNEPSAPTHISCPEDMEVDKSCQNLKKIVSDELIDPEGGCSMLHTLEDDNKNGFEDAEIQTNCLHYTSEADHSGRSPLYRGTDGSSVMGQTFAKEHEEVASKDLMLERSSSLEAQANIVIEEIRRYEFGVGQDIQGEESNVLARQHARMGRALHRLSSDLYSQDSHFVLELVQNADDNAYNPDVEAALVFLIQEGRVVVLNNETGFTAANIRALCDVGNSTKADANAGYIGHKGIGFKSVFRVTHAPEIHSNGFHVKFDTSEGDLGFILPTWIPPPAGDTMTLMSEIELPKSTVGCWNTRINLPIKASLCEGRGMSILSSKFNDLHPSLLLFLHRLRYIAVRDDVMGSVVVMHREDCGEDFVKVVHGTGTSTWMVVRQQLKVAVHRPGIKETEIVLAFQLKEVSEGTYEAYSEQQQVFAFLPLRAYGLRFILQGDFKVPSSREEVDCDSDWNQWLRSEIPALFIKSAKAFQRTIASGNPGKAVSSFMSFVPIEGEVLGFFSPLPRMILSTLRGSSCLPVEGGGWALPCVVLRGWSASTRKLLPDMFINEHLGLSYLDKDVMISDSLALKLGVQQFGVGTLVAVMKSICQKKGALVPLGLKWVEAWLLALHDCFESDQQSHHPEIYEDRCRSFRLELQRIPYIPLSNGLFTSLSDGPVWFADELSENGLGVTTILSKFVLLSSELRTIHPDMLSVQNEGVISEESAGPTTPLPSAKYPVKNSFEKLTGIFQKLGVSRLSAHQVLKSHVLPAMAKDDCLLKDHLLVVEYLGFAISHLESNCVTCSLENFSVKAQLQKCAVILTSNGLVRARQGPIHFSSAMGNNISDMRKILEGTDVSWIEVSPLYVELRVGGCELLKWRKFFKELGVTDFVEVLFTEKTVLDKSASIWKTCVWEEGLAPEGSWIVQDWHSPELRQLLMTMNTDGQNSSMKDELEFSYALKERCANILNALDCVWDEYYYQFCQASYLPLTTKVKGPQKPTSSSFLLLLQHCSWVISTLDEKLHVPAELFRSCDAVESILGSHAPYVVPQIQNEGLMEALGFRTQVLVDDALQLIRYGSHKESLFEASVAQMTRLYLFLWEKFPSHKEDVLSIFRSGASIFIPLHWNKNDKEVQRGVFYAVGSVCWSDPTNTLDLVTSYQEARLHSVVMPLCSIYHGLYDFFVGACLVQENPSFDGYLEVLKLVTAEQPPSAVLSHVMEVFSVWSMEITAGYVEPSEILRWKRRLEEMESCIFATDQQNWVSLNHQTSIVCICDDENLGKEFEQSLGCIHFLLMTDDDLKKVCKQSSYQKTNKWTLQPLVEALCIPKLSELVEREVIKYGLHDSSKIEALVGWVLPYAQRYLKHHHGDQYRYLEGIRITEALRRLQFSVVDQLYFQYSLRNSVIRSEKQTHCTCILKDDTLHIVKASLYDYCNIYVELSRLFFCGKSNFSVANFLHLITLMVTSGSPANEVENFIQNAQGIQPITEGENHWMLCTEVNEIHPGNPTEREELGAGYYPERYINQQNLTRKDIRCMVGVGWPPSSWNSGEGVAGSPENIGHLRVKDDVLHPSMGRLQVDGMTAYSSTLSTVLSGQNQVASMYQHEAVGETVGGTVERSALKDNSIWRDAPTSMDMDHDGKQMLIGDEFDVPFQHRLLDNVSMKGNSGSTKASQKVQYQRPTHVTDSVPESCSHAMDVMEVVIDGSQSLLSENMHGTGALKNYEGRDFLITHSGNKQQRERTGRAGEALVFQYLSSQHGPARVKWLNQDTESGAAYDIVVIKDSGKEEFVEVKATNSGNKDWFEISPREWEFARIHPESFTIMRVFFGNTTKQVRLLKFPNPLKLVQDRILQLVLLMPPSHANGILDTQ